MIHFTPTPVPDRSFSRSLQGDRYGLARQRGKIDNLLVGFITAGVVAIFGSVLYLNLSVFNNLDELQAESRVALAPAPDTQTSAKAAMPQASAAPSADASVAAAGAPSAVLASGAADTAPRANSAFSASAGTATAAIAPTAGGAAMKVAFVPPDEASLPNDGFGKEVRRGEDLFNHTQQLARKYVGNSLNCVNCHLDAGRKAHSAPFWAAFGAYPAYRKKTGEVNTLAERIQGCFEYSMNGKAPPLGSDELKSLQSYAFWLAKGLPAGEKVAGAGYPKLAKPAKAPDFERGGKVYAQNCALCHGANGQGQRAGGEQVFPPLWGAQSFNWGAGMHSIVNASGFIHANMPLGKGGSLSEQDAWDVALFMNSHERPQDPRFTGNVADTRAKFHDTDSSMYGKTVNGKVLGSASPKAGGSTRKGT